MNNHTNTTPTVMQQDTDTTRQDATAGVIEAAHIMGVSTDAVRARLRRGTLQGHKVAGEWQVHIPAPTVGQQDATVNRQDAQQSGDRMPTGNDLAPLVDLIERQAAELQRLIETSTMWSIRARQAEEQLKALTAGETSPEPPKIAVESPESDDQGAQGDRGWWRRLWGS